MVWNPFRPKPKPVVGDVGNIEAGNKNPPVYYDRGEVMKQVTPSTPQTGVNPYRGGGGGGGGGGSVSIGEAVSMAGGASAQQAAAQAAAQEAQRQAEVQRQNQIAAEKAAQAQERQNQIVIKASGGVRVGWGTDARTYIGNAVIPQVNMTANEYARQQKLKAIEQGIIDKKDYGRVTLTIKPTPTTQPTQRETRIVTAPQAFQSQSAIAMLPRGDLPSFNGFVLGNEMRTTRADIGKIDKKFEIRTEPYIEQRVTGTFKDERTGKVIPTTESYFVDPTGIGVQKETKVVPSMVNGQSVYNIEGYEPITFSKELVASTDKVSRFDLAVTKAKGAIVGSYEQLNQNLVDTYTSNINVEKTRDFLYKTTTATPLYYGVSKIPGGDLPSFGGFVIGNQTASENISRAVTTNQTKKADFFGMQLLRTGAIGFPGSTYIFNKEKRKEAVEFLQKGGKEFIFGTNPLIGIGVTEPVITRTQISSALQSKGVTGQVADILIPKSTFDVAVSGAGFTLYKYGSAAVRLGISGYGAYAGTSMALDKTKSKPERIAGGLIGAAGITGVVYQTAPYLKGAIARLSPSYKPVVQVEGVQSVQNIPRADKTGKIDLKLIPAGDKSTGTTPAFKSTAYGFSRSYQKAYAGTKGDVVTTARDLIPLRNRITRQAIVIGSKEKGIGFSGKPEEFGLFATPYDMPTKAAQTRVSRLGAPTSLKEFFFGFNKDSTTSIKLTPDKPQFVIFEKAPITKTGGSGTFKIGGKLSSELEVTAIPGSRIVNFMKVGVTTIKGQAVELYSAKLGGAKSVGMSLPSLRSAGLSRSTSLPSTSYSATGAFGSFFTIRSSAPSSTSVPSQPIVSGLSIISSPQRISSTPSYTITPSYTTSSRGQPSRPTPPSITIPSYPRTTPSAVSPRRASISPTSYYPSIPRTQRYLPQTPRTKSFGFKLSSIPLQKSVGKYPVFVRRFGKWKSIGLYGTARQALFKGRKYSQKTLGRSFYVPGVRPRQIVPGFRTKEEKGRGLIYIQKTGKGAISTLGTGSEKAEIQFFRSMKGGKKK